jgi:S-adenosyl-L-methionine hydrolase (adenosine-forming)
MGVITLITDFGDVGGDAARLKGAIYKTNPTATVVDVAHRIKPGAVLQAAFTLLSTHKSFPPDSVHMVSVTADVTKPSRTICLEVPKVGWFLGPDNGVFTYLMEMHRHAITYQLPAGANRPILPAVQLAQSGLLTQSLPISPADVKRDANAHARWEGQGKQTKLKAKIIHINHRGGLVTNITAAQLADRNFALTTLKIYLPSKLITANGIKQNYSQTKPGEFFGVINPYGFLSIVSLNDYVLNPNEDYRYVDSEIFVEIN